MITELTRSTTRLDEALYVLAQAGPSLDAASLDSVVRRYPEHATELTEIAIELALEALHGAEEDGVPASAAETNDAVAQAMSHFHNRLYTVRTAERTREMKRDEPINPFAELSTAELRGFAQRLNANTVFALKLRDRIIDIGTMTAGFKKRVAEELTAPFEALAAHFAGSTLVNAQASYKAEKKPEAPKKQTFEEAVRSSGLSEEQQRYLLSL
jgi:hypothetical protein